MPQVQVIQPIQQQPKRLRVAAYARVSSDSADQLNSLSVQVDYYTHLIQENPQWEFAGIYTDEGITGTSIKHREQFNRLMDDCRAGLIDRVLVKSASRFARNTADALTAVRELKSLGVTVAFEKEGFDTETANGEMLLSMICAVAQEESLSISQNMKWGIHKRMQNGTYVNASTPFGYRQENHKLVPYESEAVTVRFIYEQYLAGKSIVAITRQLNEQFPQKSVSWNAPAVQSILTNEKYIGDALLQKTYTVNTLEKKRVANNGLAPKYYVEGSHEPIIDKDVFLRVQAEIARRANILTDGKKRVYSARYALSSLVICGYCGDIYRRIKWNNRGKKSTVWRCVSRVLKKSSGIDCPARTIREEDLQMAVVTAVNDAWARKDIVLPALKANVQAVVNGDTDERLAAVDKALAEKQAELLEAGKDQSGIDEIGDAIISLREERQDILTEAAMNTELIEKLEDLTTFLDEQTEALTEYSEAMVRRLIARITVYEEKMTVEFKSGLEIDVDA